MLKKLAPLSLVFAAMGAQADTIGLHAGLGMWQPDLSGNFSSGSATNFDIEKDLGYSDTTANTFYVAVEHPIPVVPNLRIENTSLSENSSGSITGTFNGQAYNGSVKSTVDLSHTDFTAYYEFLDGLAWLNLDAGLTIRQLNGEITIDSNSLDIDTPVPLFYGKAAVDLPFAPFPVSAGALVNYLSVGGVTVSDQRFYIAAAAPLAVVDLGAEVGYRNFGIELDDVGDLNADITASGLYASATVHF
ncbi:TIGR04219 family outer membrane beta-barrel protein [Oceanospirillum sanctuarii]|uniref:TIGR04219 family outer membrane beta-barrel protein n=1 Tax=Oceanospirillum sanctuarii TaxID=1434821 RepID=UPI000A36A1D1|nr:TIGR04219 family outer membrane beta-barrel protein [Oceanospirillum sanctuarii]